MMLYFIGMNFFVCLFCSFFCVVQAAEFDAAWIWQEQNHSYTEMSTEKKGVLYLESPSWEQIGQAIAAGSKVVVVIYPNEQEAEPLEHLYTLREEMPKSWKQKIRCWQEIKYLDGVVVLLKLF